MTDDPFRLNTLSAAFRWTLVAVFCYFTLRGHRWPIVAFMVLQQLADDILARMLARKLR